ncbi:hypothetical protein DIPPA_11629 [Diplonema papillatum]|nr:hypothetical protein DIPPA_11629 [Diplonema papillatum]
MDRDEFIKYLDELPLFTGEGKFNSDVMLRLLAKCGDPHMDLPTTVHVTGTNGKGSVVAYTSHLLVANGVRTAAFTSPHPAPLCSDALTVDCAGVADSVFGAAGAKVKELLPRRFANPAKNKKVRKNYAGWHQQSNLKIRRWVGEGGVLSDPGREGDPSDPSREKEENHGPR